MVDELFIPEQDIIETDAQGVARLVAPAGIPVKKEDAIARGWVKEPKATKPSESKPAATKPSEAK